MLQNNTLPDTHLAMNSNPDDQKKSAAKIKEISHPHPPPPPKLNQETLIFDLIGSCQVPPCTEINLKSFTFFLKKNIFPFFPFWNRAI